MMNHSVNNRSGPQWKGAGHSRNPVIGEPSLLAHGGGGSGGTGPPVWSDKLCASPCSRSSGGLPWVDRAENDCRLRVVNWQLQGMSPPISYERARESISLSHENPTRPEIQRVDTDVGHTKCRPLTVGRSAASTTWIGPAIVGRSVVSTTWIGPPSVGRPARPQDYFWAGGSAASTPGIDPHSVGRPARPQGYYWAGGSVASTTGIGPSIHDCQLTIINWQLGSLDPPWLAVRHREVDVGRGRCGPEIHECRMQKADYRLQLGDPPWLAVRHRESDVGRGRCGPPAVNRSVASTTGLGPPTLSRSDRSARGIGLPVQSRRHPERSEPARRSGVGWAGGGSATMNQILRASETTLRMTRAQGISPPVHNGQLTIFNWQLDRHSPTSVQSVGCSGSPRFERAREKIAHSLHRVCRRSEMLYLEAISS